MLAVLVGGVLLVTTGHPTRGQESVRHIDADLRIAAQRLEDGVAQFALRARDADGDWTAPVTPRAHRFDPAGVRVGRWLVSSSLVLDVDKTGHGRLVRSELFEPSSTADISLVTGLDEWAGDTHYSAFHDDAGDLRTRVSIYSAAAGAPDGELRTTISCRGGETSVSVGGLPEDLSDGSAGQQVDVTWSVDNGARRSERRSVESAPTGIDLVQPAGSKLTEALLGDGTRLALTIGTTPALATSIDLETIRALPVYNNLRYCDPEVGPSGHTELRIRAQVRADQHIEFAVQQRTADGWSDNILPRARIIPAFGEATNWLSSTPVSVNVELEPAVEISLPEPVMQRDAEPIVPVIRSAPYTDSLSYEVDQRDLEGYRPTKLNSVVSVSSDQGLQLQVGCFGNERKVLLSGAPSDVTGDLLLAFDDREARVSWSIDAADGTSTLHPTDVERMIERLRQAQTLSVSLGHAESMPVSFELVHLFTTPIQANIDHCGSYAEPDWRPITEAQFVGLESGAYYAVRYREWNGFRRDSHVKTVAIDSAPAAADSPFTLLMTCNSRVLTFLIDRLPDVGNPTSIRLRLDGGDPFELPVAVFPNHDDTATVAFNPVLDALRQGTTLHFELGSDRQAQGTFSLAEQFSTPIQTNFDNCRRDYWSSLPTYIPVVAQRERLTRVLVYSAYHDEGGTVSSGVWSTAVDIPEIDGAIEMQATCYRSSVSQALIETPLEVDAGQVSVSLTVDGRSFGSTLWHKEQVGSFGLLVHPSPRQLMAQLRGASVAVIEVPELASVPITFDVSGMFDTPVQANLDECGYYNPGEVRSLPLPLNVVGVSSMPNADDGVTEVIAWLRIPGNPKTVQTDLLSFHRRVDEPNLGLIMTCGPSGVSMSIYGERTSELDGNHLRVQWRTDGGAVHQALWQVTHNSTGSTQVSPELASAVISSWRNASELELTLLDAIPSSHRFNLDALFDNPVADTFDECLTMPIPPQSPPVTGIPLTFDTHLTYAADLFHGSSWITSFVELLDNSPLPDRADDIDTRSELSVFCRIDGISVRLSRLDAMQPVFVAGDTVEVTWNIDGRSHTEMWDVWSTFNYHDISPPDDSGFYAAFKGAATVTIRVASDPVITKTYELERHGFWDTPVQPNLDTCSAGDAPLGDERPPLALELSNNAVPPTVAWNHLHPTLKSETQGHTFESESLQTLDSWINPDDPGIEGRREPEPRPL